MRLIQTQVAVALVAALLVVSQQRAEARRVRVQRIRPVAAEAESEEAAYVDQDGLPQQVQYYAAPDDRADTRSGRVVLLPAADALNGLSPSVYAGRAVTRAQDEQPVYRASPRALNAAAPTASSRAHSTKEQHSKTPPVQTIRNYSKVNDDGSFTFGYEAADGSFKEETRGTDCVVRGKYGYVDPDGNKREFTYVSGNPCDPNAVNQEEEPQVGGKDADADSGEENIPANFPSRSLRPSRPSKPATTFFQQSYNQDSEEDVDDDDLPQQAPVPVRPRVVRPTTAPTPSPARPRLIVTTPRPTTSLYQTTATSAATTAQPAVRITPRPYHSTTTEPPATTYRPQTAQQVSVTPRPVSLLPKPYSPTTAEPIRSSTPGTIDFSEELRKFQLEHNVVGTTERPGQTKGSDPIYSTELVFDPASGQYNTVVYQSLPKHQLQPQPQQISPVQRHRLQPYFAPQYAPQPQPQRLQQQPQQLQQLQQQQLQQPASLYQQQLVQQQQATLLQQSQQLFAQQQRQLHQQRSLAAASAYQQPRYQQQPQLQQVSSTAAPVKLAPAPSRYISQPVQYAAAPGHSSPPQTQFYYVSPQDAGDQRAALAAGQIDAFLRGHNLSF